MQNKWKVKEVDIELIKHTKLNSNSMGVSTYGRLKENISKSGLSSNICCYLNGNGEYVIINGNHRFKACKELGYSSLNVIYTEEKT